jgi:phage shock protein C
MQPFRGIFVYVFECEPQKGEFIVTNDFKKLYRSRDDRMLGGVAGGLGEFLTIDPTLLRLLFVLSLVLGGAGFWVYIVMWLIVPEEPLEIVAKAKPVTKTKTAAKPKSTAKKKTTTAKSAE